MRGPWYPNETMIKDRQSSETFLKATNASSDFRLPECARSVAFMAKRQKGPGQRVPLGTLKMRVGDPATSPPPPQRGVNAPHPRHQGNSAIRHLGARFRIPSHRTQNTRVSQPGRRDSEASHKAVPGVLSATRKTPSLQAPGPKLSHPQRPRRSRVSLPARGGRDCPGRYPSASVPLSLPLPRRDPPIRRAAEGSHARARARPVETAES
ncbi:uncharacterized protein LOC118894103 [Balaenoptera musculus]|uniref:Uncharacterized protein LOC118894103 n=1 Tax=Balaenoptera musculus TaxID=9771 RepID=A0A8B8X856_BALMU|nr:uncharacterized protein LOC118894103 [Balaenoptera musculus]